MACRKMNEDLAYARNTESGCKSSKKLVVKLKIRNLQLLQMKTIFKLFFGRVPLFSHGNKWVTMSPPPAVYHPLTIRLHTEFVWLSSQARPDRLSTLTAGSVRQTFCWNFEWKFPENPSFPSYCVLELTNFILCRSLPLLCTFEDAVFLLGWCSLEFPI